MSPTVPSDASPGGAPVRPAPAPRPPPVPHLAPAPRTRRATGPLAHHPRPRSARRRPVLDRKSTRLNSSHLVISYAVFCLKKKKNAHVIISYAVFCLKKKNLKNTKTARQSYGP